MGLNCEVYGDYGVYRVNGAYRVYGVCEVYGLLGFIGFIGFIGDADFKVSGVVAAALLTEGTAAKID